MLLADSEPIEDSWSSNDGLCWSYDAMVYGIVQHDDVLGTWCVVHTEWRSAYTDQEDVIYTDKESCDIVHTMCAHSIA